MSLRPTNTGLPTPLDALGIVIESEATAADATPPPRGRTPGTLIMPGARSSLLSRLGQGLLCSAIVTAMMHLLYLKKAIAYACAVVLWLLGWTTSPPKGEKPPDFAVRVEQEAKKAAGHFKPVLDNPDKEGERPRHGLIPALPSPRAALLAPAREAVGDAVDKGKQVAVTAEHKAKTVVADTKSDLLKAIMATQAENAKRQAAAEAAEKQRLLKRAAELKLTCDAEMPLGELRQAVAQAALAAARAEQKRRGINGQCPYCHRAFKIRTGSRELLGCSRCGGIFPAGKALALGPPPVNPQPMPQARRRYQ